MPSEPKSGRCVRIRLLFILISAESLGSGTKSHTRLGLDLGSGHKTSSNFLAMVFSETSCMSLSSGGRGNKAGASTFFGQRPNGSQLRTIDVGDFTEYMDEPLHCR